VPSSTNRLVDACHSTCGCILLMATLATEPGPPWCNIEVMAHHPSRRHPAVIQHCCSIRWACVSEARRTPPASPCAALAKVPKLSLQKTSSKSYTINGTRTACSCPAMPSLITIATPGTNQSRSFGALCRSKCTIGHISHDKRSFYNSP
jgi:hypothetical protein